MLFHRNEENREQSESYADTNRAATRLLLLEPTYLVMRVPWQWNRGHFFSADASCDAWSLHYVGVNLSNY